MLLRENRTRMTKPYVPISEIWKRPGLSAKSATSTAAIPNGRYSKTKASKLHGSTITASARPTQEVLKNVWRALRILGEFTAAEAAVAASVNGVSISEFGAQVYLSGLAKAGYVTRRGGTPGVKTRFCLVPSRYTGPKHPIYQRDFDQVYDPNLDQVVWRKADQAVTK